MALPFAEGEVYFKRSVLKHPAAGFDASDDKNFYKFILIEQVCNVFHECGHHKDVPAHRSHPRSTEVVSDPQQWNTDYLSWDATFVGFTDDYTGSTITRRVRLDNCRDGNVYRDYEKSGTAKVVIRPFPHGPEKYMFFDKTQLIRAVYFPLPRER